MLRESSDFAIFLQEAKEIVAKLEVDKRKKEVLYDRINALEAEINMERTRFEAVGALFVDVCELTGHGVEKLEPLV